MRVSIMTMSFCVWAFYLLRVLFFVFKTWGTEHHSCEVQKLANLSVVDFYKRSSSPQLVIPSDWILIKLSSLKSKLRDLMKFQWLSIYRFKARLSTMVPTKKTDHLRWDFQLLCETPFILVHWGFEVFVKACGVLPVPKSIAIIFPRPRAVLK